MWDRFCSDQTILDPLPAEIAPFVQKPQHRECTLVERRQLFDSLQHGDIETAGAMLMRSLDPTYVHYCKLLRFVTNCRCSIFSLELELKQTLWTPQYWGRLALHSAAGIGHVECVCSLLAATANPNILDARGLSLLFHTVQGDACAEYHFTDTVRELFQAAAETNCKRSGLSPFLTFLLSMNNRAYHLVS